MTEAYKVVKDEVPPIMKNKTSLENSLLMLKMLKSQLMKMKLKRDVS